MAYYSQHFEDLLPWSDTESDRRFVGYVIITLFVTFVGFFILHFIPISLPERKHDEVAHVIKVQIPKKELPKPPPPKPKPKEKEPEKKPKATPVPKKPEPKPVPTPVPTPTKEQIEKAARDKAAKSGLLAMQEQLSDLKNFDVNAIKSNKPTSSAGKNASAQSNASAAIIAAKSGQGSGGINTSNLGRSTGGGDLTGRDTTGVQSTIKGTGGGKGSGSGSANKRGFEEVELVFQQNRPAIQLIYNRYLRNDPSLKGKIILEITITPAGQVTHVKVVSTQITDQELIDKIIARVKLFKFQSRSNVDTTVVNYPIDLLPS